jgi:hypothetical protein
MIRGRVAAVDNGRPIRAATIRVTAPELQQPRSATTDIQSTTEAVWNRSKCKGRSRGRLRSTDLF